MIELSLESCGVGKMEMEGRTIQTQEKGLNKDRGERAARVWELLSNGNISWRN